MPGTRAYVCSFCGHDLHASGPVQVEGPCAERMLWYAREGAGVVRAGEAIALAGLDEREGFMQAYRRLADLSWEPEFSTVERFFGDEVDRAVGSKIETLLSGLWRLRISVLELFSPEVRAMVADTWFQSATRTLHSVGCSSASGCTHSMLAIGSATRRRAEGSFCRPP